MSKFMKQGLVIWMTLCMMLSLSACGTGDSHQGENSSDIEAVENDYYIDLTDLGMKLTLYLRLDAEGNFMFSNTTAFETNKSSGTVQKVEDGYVMVYTSVNGEEKSVSEGITSSFVVTDDGSLDFSGCDRIYYGSAGARTVSEEDESIVLMAYVIPEDYEAPSTETEFTSGSYKAEVTGENGVTYTHVITFFEDKTYLHFASYSEQGQIKYMSEMGTYGVSTTQLALETPEGERVSCEITDASNLVLSVLADEDATERTELTVSKADMIRMLDYYQGTGTVTGSTDTFEVSVMVYEDGSYLSTVGDFTERGLLLLDSGDGYMKQYPDHPQTGVRGLSQVATVPSGSISYDTEITIHDFRVRTSEQLTRYVCTITK